jgi:hypothetical protein
MIQVGIDLPALPAACLPAGRAGRRQGRLEPGFMIQLGTDSNQGFFYRVSCIVYHVPSTVLQYPFTHYV